MNKEEYYKRIGRINNRFKTDRVGADEEYQLVCQRNYLSTKYIENLEQQVKKQKEVINKINEFIKELYDNTDDTTCYDIDKNRKVELLDILKEMSK